MSNKQTSQQATRDMNLNPTGKGGFKDHPENRSPGGWDKEGTISYQYNRLMRMSKEELNAFEPQTIAQEIALVRLKQAKKDLGLPDAKEVTDRTEGRAAQSIRLDGSLDVNVALVEMIGDEPDDSKD